MRKLIPVAGVVAATLILGACGGDTAPTPAAQLPLRGAPVAVIDTLIADSFEAAGTAEPLRLATLSTKLMGTVDAVLVHEGDRVAAGQSLVRLDARDLDAKRAQMEGGLAEASAMQHEATLQAARIRALYADSAATKAQLDQAETGLARANAAVATARGMAAELAATTSYADVRAPFAGIITHRFVDPGSFAAPGAPLLTIEDASTLRISVSAAPDAVRGIRRGTTITASIGDTVVMATIEGVVPAGGNLYTINATVPNSAERFLSGSAATLSLPRGMRRAMLVPDAAVVRQGDLTGVRMTAAGQSTLRWVKLGRTHDGATEVLSGLAAGDTVLVVGGGR
jgi:RND family efflux transporter MFP subunit